MEVLNIGDQNRETQEHHADSKHHGRYIFRYFMRLYPFAFAGKDGNGSGAAIQTTDNARQVPDSRKTYYCFSR